MRVLVIGDDILDFYRFHKATRLCPEGPVPVLVQTGTRELFGGAGLVHTQLCELASDNKNIEYYAISRSTKERIFADDRLIVRIDKDSEWAVKDFKFPDFRDYDAIVVSDYNKGNLHFMGEMIVHNAKVVNIPVFVDAKVNWESYSGAFAAFPNEHEIIRLAKFDHVIQKLGAKGCSVDGELISQYRSHAVRDVTGAGDCFLAAFVYQWLKYPNAIDEKTRLRIAANFANQVAGISVEHIGTHVVTWDEIDKSNEIG